MTSTHAGEQVPPVDLADPYLYRDGDPTALWARLRATAPIHRNARPDGSSFWAVMTYDLAQEVLRNTEAFTSELGMRLDSNPEAVAAAAANKMLIVTDPPVHAEVRRAISSAFTPRMIRRLAANMRTTVAESLDAAVAAGEVDFTDVAARLPVSVICDMLGVPREDWDFMVDRTVVAWGSTSTDEVEEVAKLEAHTDILTYFEDLVRRRRREPRDDIVTALVNAEVAGSPLTDDEVFLNCDGIISGGNETTRHAAVGGLHAFMAHPDQWTRLTEDPGLLPVAVQEILRYTSPVMHVMRTAVRAVEIGGQRVEPGDVVTVWLASANRDERVFADPDGFDVGRERNRHIGFSHGVHRCLGAPLTATELTVFFDELIKRISGARPAGPARRSRSNLVRGFESLPVRLVARPGRKGDVAP